jgi:predicted ATP-grasp superfamily ATP-dependent carboligase
MTQDTPIGILYEHPQWFDPLFAALDRRGIDYEKLRVPDHLYDPAERRSPYRLVLNRVSAYPSGGSPPQMIQYVKNYLSHLESIRTDVINGHFSYLVATSKAMQLDILAGLGLRAPRTRVIQRPGQLVEAAEQLAFPIVLKPNVGGSGAGIVKFDDRGELEAALESGELDLGIDHTGLAQEYLSPRGKCIIRVEILNDTFLYAIRLPVSEHSFNYCPADGCNVGNPALAVDAYTPPASLICAAKQILAASRSDLGSVEYLVNEADGQVYYYDINPLSNFVANASRVVGFDPTEKLADLLLQRAADRESSG